MKQNSNDCVRLREFREEVLGAPQTEVALRAKVSQARISAIESGKLPRKWNWPPYLKAYGLTESEFHRLVTGEAKLRALTVPVAEDLPLFASVEGRGEESVVMGQETARVAGRVAV
jgi:DNA-binding XRE family transcriptional regulator